MRKGTKVLQYILRWYVLRLIFREWWKAGKEKERKMGSVPFVWSVPSSHQERNVFSIPLLPLGTYPVQKSGRPA